MTDVVEMKGVSWENRVDGVSLSVPAGQVVGLLGRSGAGKTSVLRLLACLETPTAGTIRLNGYDTVAEREAALRQVEVAIDGEPASDLDRADRPILLVDEEGVRGRTAELRASAAGRAVVLATRDASVVRDLCDRVAIVDRGRIVTDLALGREVGLSREAYYEIEVAGRLDARRRAFFDGLEVEAGDGTTIISGLVADQSALHGLLTKVRDMGLPLLSIRSGAADLEAILASRRRVGENMSHR